jgi:hypothetical protein
MGKVPIRLKEITYVLSPFEQTVMSGLTKDLGHKAAHHVANVSSRGQQGQQRGNGQEQQGAGACLPGAAAPRRAVPAGRSGGFCIDWPWEVALMLRYCVVRAPLQLRDAVLFAVAPIVGIA